jgi:tRNA A37 methylthiotransferase MiaB
LNDLLYKISYENNQKEIWKICQAIIVWKKEWKYYGYTRNFKNLEIGKFPENKIWEIVDIKITNWIALKLFWEYKWI